MVIYRNWISGLTHMNIWKLFTHIEKNYFWRRRLIIGPPPSPGGLQFLPALSLWDCQPWETVTNSCGVSREQTGLSGFLDDNSMDLNIPEVSPHETERGLDSGALNPDCKIQHSLATSMRRKEKPKLWGEVLPAKPGEEQTTPACTKVDRGAGLSPTFPITILKITPRVET